MKKKTQTLTLTVKGGVVQLRGGKRRTFEVPDELELCRRAVEAGNLLAAKFALEHCTREQLPAPPWLRAYCGETLPALVPLLRETPESAPLPLPFVRLAITLLRTKPKYKKARNRLLGDLLHLRRAEVLVTFHYMQGFSWDDAYHETIKELRGTSEAGGCAAVHKSYERALALARDPERRAFVGPYYKPLVFELLLLGSDAHKANSNKSA